MSSIWKITALVLVLALSAFPVIGQEREEQRNEPNVVGHVLDTTTETGVEALVFIGSPEHDRTLTLETDQRGFFEAFVHPGMWAYEVEADGYLPARGEFGVREGADLELEILLEPVSDEPEPNIFGIMVDSETDEPVHGMVEFFHAENEERSLAVHTDEEGGFSLHLRPGSYHWMAESRGYEPNRGRLAFREGPQRLRIEMFPMEEEEDEYDWSRIRAEFHMEDPDSDGIPNAIGFAADIDGNGEHDIEFRYVDENSDGNPESVEWMMDIPVEIWEKTMHMAMMMMKMRMQGANRLPYFEDIPPELYPGEKEWCEEEWENGCCEDGWPEEEWDDDHWPEEEWDDEWEDADIPDDEWIEEKKGQRERKMNNGKDNGPRSPEKFDDSEFEEAGDTDDEEEGPDDDPAVEEERGEDASDLSEKGTSGEKDNLAGALAAVGVLVLIVVGISAVFLYLKKRR